MQESIAAVGFVGLGVMGEPMCINLTRKGDVPVHVFDLDVQAVNRLQAQGAHGCGSLAELAAGVDVVFLSLPGIDQVEKVCLGNGGLTETPGRLKLIVDTSTSDVERSRSLARTLRDKGIGFVDAPVARSREAARQGTLMISVGSTAEEFVTLNPLLGSMGTDVLHCGPVGCGQVIKIMNNMVVLMTVNALAEALAIGRRAGVEPALLFDALSKGSADSFALRVPGMSSLLPDEFPVKTFPVDYALKDIRLALELAASGGIDAISAQTTAALLERASAAGHGDAYYPVMIKLIERR
jgi:3-hydroxyisobutyrate dehydrogenase-like beta-hydroxyacid dehydrogenase